MRKPNGDSPRYLVLVALVALMVGVGILAAPPNGRAQNGTAANTGGVVSVFLPVHSLRAIPAGALYAAARQDATPPPAANQVVLPDGDGKPIAEHACQACHKLTNLTRAHKSLDEWRDTLQTMMDRGADVPQDKVEILVQYLAKNFGPKGSAPAADAQAAPSAPAPAADAPAADAAPSTPAPAADAAPSAPAPAAGQVVLPDGDGKAIAEHACQACHKLTNLTRAHKTLDEWRDTLQTMMDRGADVPQDKIEIFVQYLAKNFGPKN